MNTSKPYNLIRHKRGWKLYNRTESFYSHDKRVLLRLARRGQLQPTTIRSLLKDLHRSGYNKTNKLRP